MAPTVSAWVSGNDDFMLLKLQHVAIMVATALDVVFSLVVSVEAPLGHQFSFRDESIFRLLTVTAQDNLGLGVAYDLDREKDMLARHRDRSTSILTV